jgi:uncharacterized delta-60 repeat protein
MKYSRLLPLLTALAFSLATVSCGGGDDTPAPPVVQPPPPAGTLVGTAGGTVTGPSGTTIVIPAGALAAEVRINIEQTAAGAPALPAGFTVAGQTYAFTPHGTTFTVPVTITLPFDPALVPAGRTPVLYKTINAQTQWEQVAGATFGTSSVTAQITSFSLGEIVIPPLQAGRVVHEWEAIFLRGGKLTPESLTAGIQDQGDLNLFFDFGGILGFPGGISVPFDGVAIGDITATDDGKEWSVGTEAPIGFAGNATDALGSQVTFKQTQTFVKRAADAELSVTFNEVFLETVDANGPLGRVCPVSYRKGLECDSIKAEIIVQVDAFEVPAELRDIEPFDIFFRLAGGATLMGIAGSWDSYANAARFSWSPLWTVEDFDFSVDELFGHAEALITMKLREPHTYNVDLSSLAVGKVFTVQSSAFVTAYNRAVSGSEFATSARAFVRDPVSTRGTTLTYHGLEPVDSTGPVTLPADVPVVPEPCVPGPGPDPAAGTIQFSGANYTQLESSNSPAITVTRAGGTAGAVTATISTSNGTAIAGVDYQPINSSVFFADGDAAPRTVLVPLIQDDASSEADITVNLALSQPGGCAALGAQSTTVLTIRDDDVPPPPPSFTVGGTVTGLAGTGLVLQDLQFLPISPGNGAFTFPLPTQTGSPYAVTIITQPVNPVQICSVVNGSGTIANANITNVAVNCVTASAGGLLDPTFGGIGKVSSDGFGGDETAMVLQSDGKMIMVGGTGGTGSDFALARFDIDGTLDETFGSAGTGKVTTDIAGGADDALGVALQSDGRIIVVGTARVGTNNDFAVVRYDINGVLDTTFGTQGKVTTDFAGGRDRAFGVAIQTDDRIVVVGDAIMPAPGNTDFAVARYSANGVPDSTFDGDGKLNTDIGGGVDIAHNVVMQGDQGAILVSGVLTLGGDPTLGHGGLARYGANGVLDGSFGTAGKRTVPNLAVGEALALQGDGKILIAGSASVAGHAQFGLMRLDANGGTDGTFGSAGLATAGFSTQDDYGRAIAVRPDGGILVAGQSSNLSNPDFAVALFDEGGTLDGSFDSDGKLTVDFFGTFDGAENVAVQTDGKIVVSGFASNGTRTNYALARIDP